MQSVRRYGHTLKCVKYSFTYKDNNSAAEFYDIMMTLSGRCVRGDADIPKDAEKAAYWRAIGEGKSEKS